MPANKNAVTRYYILDKLLANRYHNYSTEDLCRLVNEELEELKPEKKESWQVSRRTIELDLHYLEYESPFVADIEHYQIDAVSQRTLKTIKKSCHRYADPSFSIFSQKLTDDEKHLLMDKFVPLPARHYKEYDGDLNECFEDIIGVTLIEGNPLQSILFWVSDCSKDYVATKPLHESQRHYKGKKEEELRQQYSMLDGGAFFSIDCIENYELIRELSSFGKDLLVLSPDTIRQRVYNHITEQCNAYQNIINVSK